MPNCDRICLLEEELSERKITAKMAFVSLTYDQVRPLDGNKLEPAFDKEQAVLASDLKTK